MRKACIPLLLICFIACRSERQQGNKKIAAVADTVQQGNAPEFHHCDCVRNEPEPIVDKTLFPNTTFFLEDSTTGIETISLANNDSVTIRNWGCEYYCLTFRIETGRFSADTSDIQYWTEKAIVCMTDLAKGLRPPPDFLPALDTLRSHLRSSTVRKGEEIYVNHSEIGETITFDGVRQLPNSRYAIELTFAIGPL